MKLKDFFKDRIGYMIVYFMSTSIVILIMYLTLIINNGVFTLNNMLYAFIISIVLLTLFLLYDFYKNKSFYNQLNNIRYSKGDLDNILNIKDAGNTEQRIYREILLKTYKIYGDKLSKYEEERKQYIYFVNQWVHQMKTPVSVINLILQDQKNEEYREVFDSIAEENERISQGLEMMLYNARLNEFNLDFNVESIDILSVVRKVINHNKKSLIRQFIFPKISGNEDVFVETDKKWIFFVINQIFINALKYSKDVQKEKKSIIFEIKQEQSKTILSIKDEGIGIPKEDIGRVFNAFFTGKNGRKTAESTGMGMYLSKRICEELGHDLLVESQEGVGSTFSIVFYRGKNIFKL
jgi:signal transduction histidine kinase